MTASLRYLKDRHMEDGFEPFWESQRVGLVSAGKVVENWLRFILGKKDVLTIKAAVTEWAASYSSNETMTSLRKFNYRKVLKC